MLRIGTLDDEHVMLESLLMERKFTGLTERLIAAWVVAHERFFVQVDVHVLLQVLTQSEFSGTERTRELTFLLVRRQVSAQ